MVGNSGCLENCGCKHLLVRHVPADQNSHASMASPPTRVPLATSSGNLEPREGEVGIVRMSCFCQEHDVDLVCGDKLGLVYLVDIWLISLRAAGADYYIGSLVSCLTPETEAAGR